MADTTPVAAKKPPTPAHIKCLCLIASHMTASHLRAFAAQYSPEKYKSCDLTVELNLKKKKTENAEPRKKILYTDSKAKVALAAVMEEFIKDETIFENFSLEEHDNTTRKRLVDTYSEFMTVFINHSFGTMTQSDKLEKIARTLLVLNDLCAEIAILYFLYEDTSQIRSFLAALLRLGYQSTEKFNSLIAEIQPAIIKEVTIAKPKPKVETPPAVDSDGKPIVAEPKKKGPAGKKKANAAAVADTPVKSTEEIAKAMEALLNAE